MRLFNRLALAGLARLATAVTSEPAEVYILAKSSTPSSSFSSIPQIPRQVARHILFQRLGAETQLNDLPETITADEALTFVAQHGKAPKPLFGNAASPSEVEPSQLVVVLEGITEDNAKDLKKGLGAQGYTPAFTISDAPSSKANQHLVDVELSAVSASCDVAAAIQPYDKCWKGMSLVVKYDLAKNPGTILSLLDNLSSLRSAITSHTLEAALVLLPEGTRTSAQAHWTTPAPAELRRRAETPISDTVAKVVVAPGSGGVSLASDPVSAAQQTPAKMNLGCFTSFNSCVTATNNCTGHGSCIDKYAANSEDGEEGDRQCFVCACKSTKAHPEKPDQDLHVHWGGAYCQKIDVSSPFWLLAGTSILLVGIVTGCIAMLFNVGEEKLPGVIGAGVSRSK